MQQILLFRELEVPLDEIRHILLQPDFNLKDALKNHNISLRKRIIRLEELITTVEQTIKTIKGDMQMSEQEIFKGFDETEYEDEARERWGNTTRYAESRRKWVSYSKEQKEKIKEEGGKIIERIVTTNPGAIPEDTDVQMAVSDYLAYLNKYFYTCNAEFFRNLSNMWVQDERFAINYERVREGGAAFVKDAVYVFCASVREKKIGS